MKVSRRKIQWAERDNGNDISQLYRHGLEYAFVSPAMEQCCPFVWCKDFLHDIVFCVHLKKTFSLYRFFYNPEKDKQPGFDRIRVCLANENDSSFRNRVEPAVDFINQFEDEAKLVHTKARLCLKPPARYKDAFLFEGSGKYMVSPPMISLFSLLLRVGCVHTVGRPYRETLAGVAGGTVTPYQKSDATQAKEMTTGLERILAEGVENIFGDDPAKNFPRGHSEMTMHHNFGICAFSKGDTKNYVPQWHDSKKPAGYTGVPGGLFWDV